jgi:hypothetical protein
MWVVGLTALQPHRAKTASHADWTGDMVGPRTSWKSDKLLVPEANGTISVVQPVAFPLYWMGYSLFICQYVILAMHVDSLTSFVM